MSRSGNSAILSTARSGAIGAAGGKLYALTLIATDATNGASAAPAALNVVIAGAGADTVNLTALSGIVTAAPSFIYGLAGNDTLNAAGMSGPQVFIGGAGADTMTGGSGANVYAYGATSDSTAKLMDIVTNFNPARDTIDLSGLGVSLGSPVTLSASATSLAAGSIGWQTAGGNTFVYVNTSGRAEALTATNMKIALLGAVTLSTGNIVHV